MRAIAAVAFSLVSTAVGAADAADSPVKRGRTIDIADDARDTKHDAEVHTARLFVPREALADARAPRPLFLFLHGVNTDHTRFRFSGGKVMEPDIRLLIASMVASGAIPPVIVGAPSSVVGTEMPVTMWPQLDLDRFVERAARALRGVATIDLEHIIIATHSGGGCNPQGGVFTALAGTSLRVRSLFLIDGCMSVDDASIATRAPPSANVFVTWQPMTWDRPFEAYSSAFRRGSASATGLRVLEEHRPPRGNVHNAMVEITLSRHLPKVFE